MQSSCSRYSPRHLSFVIVILHVTKRDYSALHSLRRVYTVRKVVAIALTASNYAPTQNIKCGAKASEAAALGLEWSSLVASQRTSIF